MREHISVGFVIVALPALYSHPLLSLELCKKTRSEVENNGKTQILEKDFPFSTIIQCTFSGVSQAGIERPLLMVEVATSGFMGQVIEMGRTVKHPKFYLCVSVQPCTSPLHRNY